MNDSKAEHKAVLKLLERNTSNLDGKAAAENFEEITERLVDLWIGNQKDQATWPPGFQEKFAELLTRTGNRRGFIAYLNECETYALRSTQSGFQNSCYHRSHIQIIIDEFSSFADFISPASRRSLEAIDEVYKNEANDIPPIPQEELPDWTPESHWWWRAPTRHDMSQREILERLYDYDPEGWDLAQQAQEQSPKEREQEENERDQE